MNTDTKSIIDSILNKLVDASSPDRLNRVNYETLLNEISPASPDRKGVLDGALNLLNCLGLIYFEENYIAITHRNAYFALVSLSKYLNQGLTVADRPISKKEKEYFISFTKALEEIRSRKSDSAEPIHERYIVNIIITSKLTRNGRKQLVYLHKYHKDWDAYHLIGLSRKKSIEEEPLSVLIEKAMRIQLGLSNTDFSIDPTYNPPEITLPPQVSKTSGALTKYTYRIFRVKEFKTKLKLREIIKNEASKAKKEGRVPKFNEKTFRWFTLDEMRKGHSSYGGGAEKIMFSSTAIANNPEINLANIGVNAPDADDLRPQVSFRDVIGNRITYNYFYAMIGIAILGIVLIVFSPTIVRMLGTDNVLIDRSIKIIGILISAVNAFLAYLRFKS